MLLHAALLTCTLLQAAVPAPAHAQSAAPLENTPAQAEVRAALSAIERAPAAVAGYDALALALSRRARESADPLYYERAMDALRVARALDPDDRRAAIVRCWVLLGQHRFDEARDAAEALRKETPDDLQLYAILVDAHAELGEYAAAEEACQWLLDLRPGNLPGLTRASYLRQLFGDVAGARELLEQAYHSTPPRESEDRAWLLSHLAELDLESGWAERALVLADQALTLFPAYHYALAAKAKAHLALGDAPAAVETYRARYATAPHPENLYDLATALVAAGRADEAAEDFAAFESAALKETAQPDNANRQLIRYWSDVAQRPEFALRLAETERSRRADVFTRMHYAWALFGAGRVAEAHSEAQSALEVGSANPELRLWAARIARAAGADDDARAHAQALIASAPIGASAEAARGLLAELSAPR